MSVFHAPARHTTTGCIGPSLQRLDTALQGCPERGLAGEDFECFEREVFELALREAYSVPEEAVTMGVSLDGVMVAMKDGGARPSVPEPARRASQPRDRPVTRRWAARRCRSTTATAIGWTRFVCSDA